jgi:glycosyltransferase involved in cell wall biosynthesis
MLPEARARLGARRVTLVVNGIEPLAPAAAADLGFPPGTSIVGTVSRLSPEKRVDVFLRVAARLAERRSDVRFVVLGDGPDREALVQQARRLGIGPKVHFLGQVTDPRPVYAGLTVLLHTADSEGTPLALLEAMSLGVAVVATAVGGVPDLLGHGERGRLASAGDVPALAAHVARLLDEPAARAVLVAAARDHVTVDCTVTTMAEQLDEVYSAALDRRNRRGARLRPAAG